MYVVTGKVVRFFFGSLHLLVYHLQDLLRHTAEDHPDHNHLVKAIQEIAAIAKCVDKQMEKQENLLKVWQIQQSFIGNVKVRVW